MAHPLLQLQLYRYYGNQRIVEEQYPVSKRWLDLVRSQTPDLILEEGLHDHEALEKEEKPPMVTPLYCESARLVSRLARIAGKENDAAEYRELTGQIKAAYVQRFLRPGTGIVASGIQNVQAFALALDMLPAAERSPALAHLVNDIAHKHHGHMTTGIFGTKFLLEVLSREGEIETANRMVSQRDFPGWGYMLEHGATTLWEHWKLDDNTFSHNHPMFGSVSQWFYNWLGGIEPDDDAMGFDRIQLHPRFVKGVDWANCSVETVRGTVGCNWKRDGRRIALDIVVPVGATATLSLPVRAAGNVIENGCPAAESEGVESIPGSDGLAQFRLASGTYRFEVQG